MSEILRLFLPVLFPSWRFFSEVSASPRVLFRVGQGTWQDATALPGHLSVCQSLASLLWNADRNEVLFLASLAERHLADPETHGLAPIVRRLSHHHAVQSPFDLRLMLVDGTGARIVHESHGHGV